MIGEGSLFSGESYLALGRETVFGTGVTTTAGLEFLSAGIKTTKDSKILEQVSRNRTYDKRISLSKKIEGEVEFYYFPKLDSCNYILQNALGGAITSATATGESVGGTAFSHEIEVGSMDGTYKSLSINMRKGPATGGKVFEYSGGRINELGIVAEMEEALKMTAGLIVKDSSLTVNDVEAALTYTCAQPLVFTDGRFSAESTFASLTSSSYWHVQNIEFNLANNLKSENESRRIGSDTLDVLPVGIQSHEMTVSMRFDTTTAYDAMMEGTVLAAEFEFLGETITGSLIQEGLKLQFPKLYVKDAGDPEIGGPDETIVSEVTFDILRDCSSAAGYAIKAIVTNDTAAY